jgi:hypothetical protein
MPWSGDKIDHYGTCLKILYLWQEKQKYKCYNEEVQYKIMEMEKLEMSHNSSIVDTDRNGFLTPAVKTNCLDGINPNKGWF